MNVEAGYQGSDTAAENAYECLLGFLRVDQRPRQLVWLRLCELHEATEFVKVKHTVIVPLLFKIEWLLFDTYEPPESVRSKLADVFPRHKRSHRPSDKNNIRKVLCVKERIQVTGVLWECMPGFSLFRATMASEIECDYSIRSTGRPR